MTSIRIGRYLDGGVLEVEQALGRGDDDTAAGEIDVGHDRRARTG